MTEAELSSAPPPAAVNDNTRPATAAERAMAYLMDLALATIIASLASRVASPLIMASGFAEPTVGFFLAANLVEFLAATLFFAGFECSKAGATPGKRLLGLQVCHQNGGRIGPVRSAWRFLCQLLSGMGLIGLFFMFFTRRQQTLHDLLSRTVVVKH